MKLAWFFHPSYLSMYYNFAIAVLILKMLKGLNGHFVKSLFMVGLILFLAVMILLLSSKAGVFTLGAIILLAALYSWKKMKSKLTGLLIVGSGVALFGISYWLAPVAFSRISAAGHAVSSQPSSARLQSESNADRMAVWVTAIGILKENYLTGVGTGDVKDALLDGYKKNNMIPAFEHQFNAHNQYLQTFVTLGIGGFLLLVVLMVHPALWAFRNGQVLYFAFLLIFGMNILVESMLEVQAGVVFYAFFNILLFTAKRNGDTVS
jgi:O-antigen ligase